MKCWRCKRIRALIDGLCDDCTLALFGCLFPWLAETKKESEGGDASVDREEIPEGKKALRT